MDEDGEPLMDPDDVQSDREASPEARFDDEDEDDWRRSRSPTPILDDDKTGKPRKRLIKKSGKDATPSPVRSESPGNGLDDWDEDQQEEEEEASSSKKRKGYDMLKTGMGKGESFGKEKKKKKKEKVERGGKGWASSSSLKGGKDQGVDPEMEELWDTIAGGNSEV